MTEPDTPTAAGGDPTRRCKGRSKTTKLPCRGWAMRGSEVCRMHGGAARQVRAKAAARVVEAAAGDAVRRMHIEPVTNPLVALGLVAGELVAIKDRLGGIVESLRDEQLRSTDDKGSEQVRGELSAYMGLLNSTVAALATIAKLDIDERLARIDEATALMVLRAIDAGLAAVGVTGPAVVTARQAAGRHLKIAA